MRQKEIEQNARSVPERLQILHQFVEELHENGMLLRHRVNVFHCHRQHALSHHFGKIRDHLRHSVDVFVELSLTIPTKTHIFPRVMDFFVVQLAAVEVRGDESVDQMDESLGEGKRRHFCASVRSCPWS